MSDYTLLLGDAATVLKTLPANSVHTCVTSPPYFGLRSYLHNGHDDKHLEIGTEETPDAYVAKLVDVFREVRRVLHPTGVLFLNLGDSYNTQPAGNKTPSGFQQNSSGGQAGALSQYGNNMRRTNIPGLKPKDLIGIPWMVAFALRADGWYLRSAITWCKGNPMPESVTDRCTSATEMVFMLAKNERYFYDADAVREPYNPNSLGRYKYEFGHGSAAAVAKSPAVGNGNGHSADPNPAGRNRRNWWVVNSEPYVGAHYATMPTKLVEPCILAGTSAHGCCSACGSPYERVVESARGFDGNGNCNGCGQPRSKHKQGEKSSMRSQTWGKDSNSSTMLADGAVPCGANNTVGWEPTCTCNAPVTECVVLDPFAGSGTVLAVALKFGRRAIGIDLDARNAPLVHDRIGRSQPLLLAVTP